MTDLKNSLARRSGSVGGVLPIGLNVNLESWWLPSNGVGGVGQCALPSLLAWWCCCPFFLSSCACCCLLPLWWLWPLPFTFFCAPGAVCGCDESSGRLALSSAKQLGPNLNACGWCGKLLVNCWLVTGGGESSGGQSKSKLSSGCSPSVVVTCATRKITFNINFWIFILIKKKKCAREIENF